MFLNDRNDHFIESEDNPDDKSAGVSQIMQQIVGIGGKRHFPCSAVETHRKIDQSENHYPRDNVKRITFLFLKQYKEIIDYNITVQSVVYS